MGMLTGDLPNFDARYRIIRIDGWILSTTDQRPTLSDLQTIAKECGRSVFLMEPDDDGTIIESGYACPKHSRHDYLTPA